jgi:hypothetical protein
VSYENNVLNFVLGAGNLCWNVFVACPHFCVNVRAQLFIRFPHFTLFFFFRSVLGRVPYCTYMLVDTRHLDCITVGDLVRYSFLTFHAFFGPYRHTRTWLTDSTEVKVLYLR